MANSKLGPAPRTGEATTTNYGWTLPTVGASVDAWGGYINTDLIGIDSTIYGLQTSKLSIAGTATNDSAAAGSIGEVISSAIASPGGAMTSNTIANITSISLTPGDWDVTGEVSIAIGAGAATYVAAAIGVTSATIPASGIGSARFILYTAFTASVTSTFPLHACRVSLAATTTYYLVASVVFASGTTTAFGNIWARRAR